MRFTPFYLLGLVAAAEAAILPNPQELPLLFPRKDGNSGSGNSGSGSGGSGSGGGTSCDFTLWGKVSAELNTLFRTSNGQCNDDARAAIRLIFHDCGTWDKSQGLSGGCDGSLVLTVEMNR